MPQLAGSFYKRHAVTAAIWPLRLLVGARFQVLFHSPPGVLFTFPSRYWCAIGHRRVFSLGGWSPLLRTGFHVPGPTRVPSAPRERELRLRGCYPLRPAFPCRFGCSVLCDWACRVRACRRDGPTTPMRQRLAAHTRAWVWAGALSLAATRAISVDFSSSGYLDVSVPRVVPADPMCSDERSRAMVPAGFPHSETSG